VHKPERSVRAEKERQTRLFEEDTATERPPLTLLDAPEDRRSGSSEEALEAMSRQVELKLRDFGIEVEVVAVHPGPVITRFELQPAAGVKVSRISNLAKDLARALSAVSVRVIEQIPGRSVVGLEIPNEDRETVRLGEILQSEEYDQARSSVTLALGKDINGHPVVADLDKMPHLLVAGTTGSGKSVAINAMLLSLVYKSRPDEVRLILVDPKMLELSVYDGITHLLAPVVTDMNEAANALRWCVAEMERRYRLMASLGVRNLAGYNRKVREAAQRGEPIADPLHESGEMDAEPPQLEPLPKIVVVVDELADLMMAAGDDVEGPISRLAQMARAVGIHLILATQRPSVDVVTGVIKANFPSRIAFEVASRVDSRTILDQGGAEDLVGNGDMLFLSGSDLKRLQGPFVSVEEVEEVVNHVADQPGVTPYTLPSLQDAGHGPDETLGVEDTDEKFEEAARVIVRRQQGSVSLLQRKLAVGYTRAARIVDQLEEAGIVGPFNGTKARDVLVDDEQALDALLHGKDAEETDPEEA